MTSILLEKPHNPLNVKLPNKQFETMRQLIGDAEKYYDAGENKVCNDMLTTLREYIEMVTSKNGK